MTMISVQSGFLKVDSGETTLKCSVKK